MTPSQVMEPDIPGMIMLVVDCPSPSYIESLKNNSTLHKYTTSEQRADIVIHLSNKDVCDNLEYVKWKDKYVFLIHKQHM